MPSHREDPHLRVSALRRAVEPAYVQITNVNVDSQPSKRLLLVLRTNGCAYEKNNMGCTMCGFKSYAIDASVLRITKWHLIIQFEKAISFARLGDNRIQQIDLLTIGSFLNDAEVPPTFRVYSMKRIAELVHIRKVLVESRTEYVSTRRIMALKESLRSDQQLELAIGVESSNEHLRNAILRKGLSWKQLEEVVATCGHCGVSIAFYLLIKPQTLTEDQAIRDSVRSAEEVALLADKFCVPFRVAFEPVFVSCGTPLEEAYKSGCYQVVNLWSVIEVIKRTHHLGTVFVGTSDENLSNGQKPGSCPLCSEQLSRAIEDFNGKQNVIVFECLSCQCKKTWEDMLRTGRRNIELGAQEPRGLDGA